MCELFSFRAKKLFFLTNACVAGGSAGKGSTSDDKSGQAA